MKTNAKHETPRGNRNEDAMSTQPSQINPTETSIESGHKLEDLLDITRAAKLLGISPKTLRDHVLHRRIDYVKRRPCALPPGSALGLH